MSDSADSFARAELTQRRLLAEPGHSDRRPPSLGAQEGLDLAAASEQPRVQLGQGVLGRATAQELLVKDRESVEDRDGDLTSVAAQKASLNPVARSLQDRGLQRPATGRACEMFDEIVAQSTCPESVVGKGPRPGLVTLGEYRQATRACSTKNTIGCES